MPKLDDRLKAVARQIRSRVHADIGSDHGHLLKALLSSGQIQRGIAIENKQQPFENSSTTLQGLSAEVRLDDGLRGLEPGEADSLSLCGMGGDLIAQILDAFPDRVPPCIVLQPNCHPESVRQWGLRAGYHLVDEQIVWGRQQYVIIRLERRSPPADPAYNGIDREAAELFGPLIIKRWQPDFVAALQQEQCYLQFLPRLNAESQFRIDRIEELLRHGGE